METEKTQAQEKVIPQLPAYGTPIPRASADQQKPLTRILTSRLPRRAIPLPKGIIHSSNIHVKHKKKGSYVT